MNKEDVINYVMTTPGNPNKAVLSGILDSIANAGGGTLIVHIDYDNRTVDKTWQEVHDALANGVPSYFAYSDSEETEVGKMDFITALLPITDAHEILDEKTGIRTYEVRSGETMFFVADTKDGYLHFE